MCLAVCAGLFAVLVPGVMARVGVGMGGGEVRLTEQIKPGGIYNLPPMRIFNTGDETATYAMGVAFQQEYSELRPDKNWFSFNPSTFTLESGKSQDVAVTMVVPVRATPGDYFAYLESGPVSSSVPGTTSVGIAVGLKLYFTMVPANIWQAMAFRVTSFFQTYAPWSWVGLGVIVAAALVMVLKRFISFRVTLR